LNPTPQERLRQAFSHFPAWFSSIVHFALRQKAIIAICNRSALATTSKPLIYKGFINKKSWHDACSIHGIT